MKAPEWSQHFFHCKPMGIFPDAQGQLTSQTKNWSARNSSSFKLVLVSAAAILGVVTTFYIDFKTLKGNLLCSP